MRQRLERLLCVKSLVTIALTVVFCRLAVTGAVSAQQFLTIFTVVISFYFGTQVERVRPAAEYSKSPAVRGGWTTGDPLQK